MTFEKIPIASSIKLVPQLHKLQGKPVITITLTIAPAKIHEQSWTVTKLCNCFLNKKFHMRIIWMLNSQYL
ncbi:hypothetical protein FGO68_gene10989 [Halteria grandinella]|uniref:Uncharacterized protein n=1 Tax=Halteria grandinella TaxID=5974 RepID=A0A8J8SYI6_HALGN|nr:hypothetical protein FGO68_gene10989 [Halteria grandinella]